MRRKTTQKNIALMVGCSTVYVSRVLNHPKDHNTEKAKMIKRLAHDHLESIIKDPLFLQLIRKYRPKTREEEDTLFEWRSTFNLHNDKLKELEKIK